MDVNTTGGSQRILLVDDEPRVLRGLQRQLRDPRWQVHTADSGEAALLMLADRPFDVVVTEYRMRGMTGLALLDHVRERHPEMVRIILTGDVDEGPALRSTAVAHQCLTKPMRPELLVTALERAESLREMLAREDLRRMIGRLGSLPSSPTLWTCLQSQLSDPDVSAADIARTICADVAMTTKVLQLVNSAFMGLPRTVTSVAEAVAYLGVEMVRNLVVSVEAFRSFPPSSAVSAFSIDALSRHGQACLQLVLHLVRHHELRDHAAAAALLQDVGQLIYANCQPALLATLAEQALAEQRPLHEVESEQLGFTHADVGAYLLTLWGLPGPVVDAVSQHHDPLTQGARAELTVREAVRVAHLLVHTRRAGARDSFERVTTHDADTELLAALAPSTYDRWTRYADRDEDTVSAPGPVHDDPGGAPRRRPPDGLDGLAGAST